MNWSKEDLEKAEKRIKTDVPKVDAKKKAEKSDTKPFKHIKDVLIEYGLTFTQEQRFSSLRAFKFDLAVQSEMIAVEYEGVMSEKSRHTTRTGFTNDTTKYNMAQAKGWKVFRYTILNYQNFEIDLLRHLYFKSIKNKQ